MAYKVMAFIVMAYVVMACTAMAWIVMGCIIMVYIGMGCIDMAYIVISRDAKQGAHVLERRVHVCVRSVACVRACVCVCVRANVRLCAPAFNVTPVCACA